ncbi:MAG: hypothetical protein MPK62_01875 [Alphaproteobacteria bacterium]|nr:hypothetical protein [Alphaproteobacteria bacterium]MDA8029882.1 hypothetical protein [Alphaproteobacteria bacterium]
MHGNGMMSQGDLNGMKKMDTIYEHSLGAYDKFKDVVRRVSAGANMSGVSMSVGSALKKMDSTHQMLWKDVVKLDNLQVFSRKAEMYQNDMVKKINVMDGHVIKVMKALEHGKMADLDRIKPVGMSSFTL